MNIIRTGLSISSIPGMTAGMMGHLSSDVFKIQINPQSKVRMIDLIKTAVVPDRHRDKNTHQGQVRAQRGVFPECVFSLWGEVSVSAEA